MRSARTTLGTVALALAPGVVAAGSPAAGGPSEPAAPQAGAAVRPAVAPGAPAGLGRPVLELLDPEVDQAALRLTFRVHNRGQADLAPATVTVRYRVDSVVRGPARPVADGSFVADRVAVAVGATAPLGTVVLPDRQRAFASEHVTVSLAVTVAGAPAVEPASASFPLRWRTRTAVLDAGTLRAAGAARFRIRLVGRGPAVPPGLVAREDCLVALGTGAGEAEHRFALPPGAAVPVGAGASWLVLVNSTGGETQGEQALRVRNGRVTLRLEVAGRPADGLKTGVLAADRFDDDALPDLPLAPFPVTAALSLGIDRVRATLCVVGATAEAAPSVPVIPGPLARLGPAARSAVEGMRGAVVQGVTALLATADARTLIESLLARALAAGGPVSAVYAIEGRGDWIVVTCV